MAIKRINEFDQLPSSGVTPDDVLLIMDDPSGTAITKKVGVKDLYTLSQISINISGTINNWNPTQADYIFASGTTTITGLNNSYTGDAIAVCNIGESGTITFAHQNSGSLANNRFVCPNYIDYTLQPKSNTILIVKDKIANKWRIM